MIETPWKHQLQTANFDMTRERVYDASDPGTGKTRAHLMAFAKRRNRGGGRALVVCPMSLQIPAWEGDVRKYFKDLTIAHAFTGTYKGESTRRLAFKSGADIVTINTDGIKWVKNTNNAVRLLKDFDTLIIDEVTYYKHRSAARSRAMRELAPRFEFRIGMSGTPRANAITDVWHQFRVLDDGQRLGKFFGPFQEQFCIPVHNGYGYDWKDRGDANKRLMPLVQDMLIRHRFDDVMDVPPNYTRTVTYTLPDKLMRDYLEFEAESYLALQSGEVVNAVNAAARRTKLLQIASGAAYDADGKVASLHPGRYELVMDLVAARDHSVVFFNWRHQRDGLIAQAKKRGISYAHIDGTVPHKRRAAIVEEYQAGFYQVLFLHPETGAHGLTLTRGRTTIWASPQYKPDIDTQGLYRIYRGGQTKKTETIHIEAAGTVESLVFGNRGGKYAGLRGLTDLIEEAQRLR